MQANHPNLVWRSKRRSCKPQLLPENAHGIAWTQRIDNISRKSLSFEIRYPEKHLAFQKTEGTRQSNRKIRQNYSTLERLKLDLNRPEKNHYSIPDAVFCDKSKPVKLFSWVAPHLCNTPRSH